jgi:transposase
MSKIHLIQGTQYCRIDINAKSLIVAIQRVGRPVEQRNFSNNPSFFRVDAQGLLVPGLCGVGHGRCHSGRCVQLVACLKVVEALALVIFSVPDCDAHRSVHC